MKHADREYLTGAGSSTLTYQITETNGAIHTISCNYLFNNAGELTLRSGKRGDTTLVGLFPAGHWSSCVQLAKNVSSREVESEDEAR